MTFRSWMKVMCVASALAAGRLDAAQAADIGEMTVQQYLNFCDPNAALAAKANCTYYTLGLLNGFVLGDAHAQVNMGKTTVTSTYCVPEGMNMDEVISRLYFELRRDPRKRADQFLAALPFALESMYPCARGK